MILDFVTSFISFFVALLLIFLWDEYARKKRWKREKDTWYSLLVDSKMEIERISGGETKLTMEIEDVLRM